MPAPEDRDKILKEVLIAQMLEDLGVEFLTGYQEPWLRTLCDQLIRKGWRKA